MSHFHVGMNVPGYMPESDIDIAETKSDAIALLVERKRSILEDHYTLGDDSDSIRVAGDARRDLGYFVTYPDRRYHLGLVIWATECHETDCESEYV